jgi:hypothetical protein
LEIRELGAEGVMKFDTSPKPQSKRYVENLGWTIRQTPAGLPFLGLLIFSPHQRK